MLTWIATTKQRIKETLIDTYPTLFLLGVASMIFALLTYPVCLSPNTLIIGAEHSDIYPHIWGYWRTERILEQGSWNFIEPYLNFPYTQQLYHVDLLNSLLVSLAHLVFPFVFSINLVIFLQWLLIVFATQQFCLRYRDGCKYSTANLLAIAFACCPFFLNFPLASGVLERTNFAWVVGYFYFFTKISQVSSRTETISISIGTILCFFLATMGAWHYAIFCLLMSVGWFGYDLWNHSSTWKAIRSYFPTALGCGIVSVGFSSVAKNSIEEQGMISRNTTLFWDWHTPIEMLQDSSVLDFFLPRLFENHGSDLLYETLYIGWILPILAMIGYFSSKKYSTNIFVYLGWYFAMIALGPTISIGNYQIYSPIFYATASIIPYFTTMEVPWEYSILAIFCLLLPAGRGIEFLEEKASFPAKKFIFVGITFLIGVDYVLVAPTPFPIPHNQISINSAVEHIRVQNQADIIPTAVLDFPTLSNNPSIMPYHQYLLNQTRHQRPIPYTIQNSWIEQDVFWRNASQNAIHHQKQSLEQICRNSLPLDQHRGNEWCLSKEDIQKQLEKQGFQWFIVHHQYIPAFALPSQQQIFSSIFGSPVVEDTQVSIYKIY